jgi:Asp-tRNA(Asn)/Glu-tRNA(Gln) amidotransferase A subunit family amidase
MDERLNAAITWLDEPLQRTNEGPLAGRTLLVKDIIDTAGIRTTYGSKMYGDHVPERNATVVERVLDAGAVVLGKGNLPEFAWSVAGYNPWYGTVHNPTHPGKTTGGSSSGNAAAIAGGLCELGIGTDTGCSIRLPVACCEIVGLKPAWGRIPIDGVFPVAPTLDTVGPMASSVEDVALLWSVMSGSPVPEPALEGLTVGLLRQPPAVGDGRSTERSDLAEQWVGDIEQLGARVVEASVPDATGDTFAMFFHEALKAHEATFPSRADEYAETIRPKLEAAAKRTPEEIEDGYRALEEWRRLEPPVDLYLSPGYVVDLPAADADEMEIRLPLSSFLRWVNLTGWAGLAIGNMQLVAPRDETVLAAGLALERG